MDVGSADCLAQHGLHITEQASNHEVLPKLLDPSIPDRDRHYSSRPDAISVTPCPSYQNRPFSFLSHLVLHSMRGNKDLISSSTTPARQLQELNIHFIEIKYCEGTRPGTQLEAPWQQHSEKKKRKVYASQKAACIKE
eukprot:59486-Pelagomonas_calceolata.AAC.1